jgi:hypothetical protein
MRSPILISTLLAFVSLEAALYATAGRQPYRANGTQRTAETAPAHVPKPNHIFSQIVPLLLQKTSVPLRLPEYVPYSDDKETKLYSILKVAEPERYSIELTWLQDCDGGNACHVGYVGASKTPFPSERKRRVPVSLAGGIGGFFVGFDCGAHCDDASLDWKEGDYYYGISLKAADKNTLVRMANSAIEGAAHGNPEKGPITNYPPNKRRYRRSGIDSER